MLTGPGLEVKPLILISGLAPGGAERVTASLVIRLWNRGIPVPICTVTSRHDGPLAAELGAHGIDRRDLGARRLTDPRAFGRLVRMVRAEGIDLVHAHGQDAAIVAAAARLGATPRHRRPRLLITRHVLDEPSGDWRQRARARLTLGAFRRADLPVAVSRATAERLAELARIPVEAIRVLLNGIDVDTYSRPCTHRAHTALLRHLSLPVDAPLVLLPAVLRDGKGHGTLLEGLPALRPRTPPAHFLLAGSGPLEPEFRRRASRHRDRVHFLGHRTDMPELMAASDLVVLPSRSEALPTVLMEAAAAGRPVVATRVGGVAEVVEDGRTGFLVPPDDPRALARAVDEMLDDPARARAFGERARSRARERFSLDRQAEGTLELWRCASRQGPS